MKRRWDDTSESIPSSYATQVLIIEFKIINNSSEILHTAINVSRLNQYIYRRSADAAASGKYEWPMLESLIIDNMRLVIFAHSNGMDSSCAFMVCPDGMFYTFDHFQETNWNNGTCDSRSEVFDPDVDLFLMNHWMNKPETDLPWDGNVEEFNRYDSLLDKFRLCTARMPNIIAVDFWSIKDVLDFVMEVNRDRAGGGNNGGGGGTMAETTPRIKGGK